MFVDHLKRFKIKKDKRDVVIFALILLLGLFVYKDSLWAEFQYDDYPAIVDNPLIKHINPALIWQSNPSRFLTNFTFALNYFIGGLNTLGWHIFNVLIHVINVNLVFHLCLLIFQTPRFNDVYSPSAQEKMAFLSALVFLLHPIQTQAVIYIVQRATLLATAFYLGALYFYIKARIKDHFSCYVKAVICCVLGMFTKPLYMTFPLAIILSDMILFNRTKMDRKHLIVFLLLSLPLVVIPLFLMGMDHLSELAVGGFQAGSYKSHLLTQLVVISAYIKLLFVPIGQNLDYDFPMMNSFFQTPVILSFAACVMLMILLTRIFHRQRLIVFSVVWFFLALIPVLIFPLSDVIFEHWLYLPMFGFALGITIVLSNIFKTKRMYTPAMVCLLCILSLLTYQRVFVWKDAIALMQDTVNKSSAKARPHNNLGSVYYRKGRLKEAAESFAKAIVLDPQYHIARNNLAHLYLEQGQFERAQTMFEDLVKAVPEYADPHIGLGTVSLKLGRHEEAYREFDIARQLAPTNSAIYIGLGNLYQNTGHYHLAKAEYQRVLWLRPESYSAYYNLGNVYIKEKNFYEALLNYNLTIKLNPGLGEAYNNIGNIYYYFHDNSSAVEFYEKAIERDPLLAAGYYNLANALHELGQIQQSRDAVTVALKLYQDQGQWNKARLIQRILSDTEDVKKD